MSDAAMGSARSTPRRGTGWALGHLAGVEIRMHPTFLILVALALLGWLGPPLTGLAWIAVVFASVVTHELGHAIVARSRGLVVRDIVLLPIGGASEIEGIADDPDRELAVAAAGPLTSAGLAVALGAVAVLTGAGLGSPWQPSDSVVGRVAWMNISLAAFNVLPVLPMDGGRMLRAVWARRLGFEEATIRAARLGRVLAIAMGVVGILLMPWLIVIAAFVYVAGRSEETSAIVHARLAGMVVGDVMTPLAEDVHLGAVTVHERDPLEQAVERLAATDDGIVTVVDANEHVVGVLLARRVRELLRERGEVER